MSTDHCQVPKIKGENILTACGIKQDMVRVGVIWRDFLK